ncbi:NlpC/P60 family protein [Streptomyces sp. NPDC087420]|uniref:C40 family peptidase n=1 Tax=Streptomyces sp. NPDC087420 TaxID=3365785 RepID=UPI0038387A0E
MSARTLRSFCTTALITATALTVVPLAPTATAEPEPAPVGSGRIAPEGPGDAGGPTGTAPGAGGPAGTVPGASGPGATAPGGIAGMLARLQRLYQDAEEAGEAFNGTEVELERLRAEARRLTSGLDRARTALALSRDDAGRLAREQYQGRSGLSGYARFLLARDPRSALDEGHLMKRAARVRAETLTRLTGGERRASALADAARWALRRQQVLAARQKKEHDTVRARLGEVEKLLASLTPGQIAALAALEKAATDKAQRELITSGALGDPPGASAEGGPKGQGGSAGSAGRQVGSARSAGPAGRAEAGLRTGSDRPARSGAPSPQGGDALSYAVDQIGKPYEWGAEGPGSFDCSGLTSEAWARAGVAVPRTSQQQWRDLPRVPLDRLRPGDLVVYFPKATHVAIYLGDGMVIQAPRPGARIKVSPIAANPLLGAVRPDPDADPMTSYEPPVLPPDADAASSDSPNSSDSSDSSDLGNDVSMYDAPRTVPATPGA